MNSSFEYYKVFYFVSKYQNLTRAANALRTSQPAITRTIRNLENELGCRLFVRSKTGMKHTPEGEILFKYVSEGCEQFWKGENILSNLLNPDDGSIYISATETALHCFLFQAIEDYKSKYPNIHFKILNNSSRDSVRMIKEGRADFAFISSTVDVEKPLKAISLRKYRDILVAGRKFKFLEEKEHALHELTDYPWLSLTADSFTRTYLDSFFNKHELSFRPDVEVDTTDMILFAAKHNMGLGFIPHEFAAALLETGELAEIKVDEEFPERDILLVYDEESPLSAAARQFRTFIKNYNSIEQNGFRIF